MENQINNILKDLYKIDVGLKRHEEKLIKIIKELLASRPDTKFNPAFVAQLRTEVLKRAQEFGKGSETSVSWMQIMNLGKLTYALVGAVLAVLIILPAVVLFNRSSGVPIKLSKNNLDLAGETKIAKLENNAFGSLRGISGNEQAVGGKTNSSISASAALEAADEFAPVVYGLGGDGGLVTSEKAIVMPVPDIINYKYVYTGPELIASESQLPVYRQLAGNDMGKSLSGVLNSLDLGLIDLNKFKNRSLTNFTITEDRDFGYQINFDAQNANLSINTNWQKWPQTGSECRDEACYDKYRLTMEDVPADEKLIAIADEFLTDYNINISGYEPGQVRTEWEKTLYRDESRKLYIPDAATVIYPAVVEGKTVYDESGHPSGLTVNVNIRYKKVSGLYNFKLVDYESSDYEAEIDTDRLLQYAEHGGRYGNYAYPETDKTVEIKLGEPKLSLIRYWHYDQSKLKGEELLAPAYIFPIIEKPEQDYFYRQSVVVPLIKELLDEAGQDSSIGISRPMPLLERSDIEQVEAVEDIPGLESGASPARLPETDEEK